LLWMTRLTLITLVCILVPCSVAFVYFEFWRLQWEDALMKVVIALFIADGERMLCGTALWSMIRLQNEGHCDWLNYRGWIVWSVLKAATVITLTILLWIHASGVRTLGAGN
jgi:magnesium-transporting ATPase (P-type)